MIQVCKEKDIYFEWLAYLKREAHFTVELSNGEVIYQDDYRSECPQNTLPVPSPERTWDRLKEYVRTNGYWIKNIWLQNFNNIVKPLPDEADGYFFKKGMLGQLFSQSARHFYILGYLDLRKGIVKTFKYGVPELLLSEVEERKIPVADPCLLVRPGIEVIP